MSDPNVKIVENYSDGLRRLNEHVDVALRTAGFATSTAAIHGLMEIAASAAVATGCDFEDFVRLTICAWDCHTNRDMDYEEIIGDSTDAAN